MIDQCIIRSINSQWIVQNSRSYVLLHGHCHLKIRPQATDGFPVGVDATVVMLQAGEYLFQVECAGCCGMAGAFSNETEYNELSIQIGEMKPFFRTTHSSGTRYYQCRDRGFMSGSIM